MRIALTGLIQPDQLYTTSDDAFQFVIRVLVFGVILGLCLLITRGPS